MSHIDDDGIQYYEYIQSDTWAMKVADAKRRANYRCQICNRHEDETILDGHHRTYERLGRELPEDITILCRDCHELYEKNKRLAKYGSTFQAGNPMHQIGILLAKVVSEAAEQRYDGLRTGYEPLDRIVEWSKGKLVVVVGRPGVGKSALVNSIALNAARQQSVSVVYFSLQASAEQVVTHLLSMETGVEYQRLRRGNLNEEEWPIILKAKEALEKLAFLVDETPIQTLDGIREKCYDVILEQGAIDLVVVDGGELLLPNSPNGSRAKDKDAHSLAQELKRIAAEINALVIVTLPADRRIDQRADKRPMLVDIPEPWTQMADIVLAIHREDYYMEDSDQPGVMDLCILKNRVGDVGIVKVFLQKELGQVRDLAQTITKLDY